MNLTVESGHIFKLVKTVFRENPRHYFKFNLIGLILKPKKYWLVSCKDWKALKLLMLTATNIQCKILGIPSFCLPEAF